VLNAVWTSSLVALLSLTTTIPCSTDPVQQGIAALERHRNITLAELPEVTASAETASAEDAAGAEDDVDAPGGPEPTTLLLAGAGLVGLAFSARRLKRSMPAGH